VTWASTNTLMLDASNAVLLNAPISGPSGTLGLQSGIGGIQQKASGAGINVANLWAYSAGGNINVNGAGNTISLVGMATFTGGNIDLVTSRLGSRISPPK